MENICSKNCMYQWICSYCKNTFCDDTLVPYIIDNNSGYLNSFYLCNECKKKYSTNNITKEDIYKK